MQLDPLNYEEFNNLNNEPPFSSTFFEESNGGEDYGLFMEVAPYAQVLAKSPMVSILTLPLGHHDDHV
jgi:hypothetical protein